MNKQEIIEKIKMMTVETLFSGTSFVKQPDVIKLIKQLDEQKPVKVPQFVADWIENCKRGLSLRQAISQIHVGIELDDWLMEVDADGAFVNQETFARAWLDGYEVEEEKRYLVKIKGNIKENVLVYRELLERYFFTKSLNLDNAIYSHTRKELEEAGFGWVFDCEGVEIEEVE